MSEVYKNLPRDTFLYITALITLIVVAVSFGMAVFNYIDFYFPDPATDYYFIGASPYESAIRQAMAMLIVVFPVFFWVSRFLRKDIALHPEKKELKIRKWLLYFTIFVAALVIIGDFVAVVNSFLTGELTTRFILKALTIFFISGSTFYYYLSQLREKDVKWISVFSWMIIVAVIAVVSAGFVVIGSPLAQREKRFDEKRVQDLSVIQNYITNYWQNKKTLPAKLSDLADPLLGTFVPVDPETGEPYEYKILGNLKFELCATFKTESGDVRRSVPKVYPSRGQDNWQHGAGHVCFERIIDPDFFGAKPPPDRH